MDSELGDVAGAGGRGPHAMQRRFAAGDGDGGGPAGIGGGPSHEPVEVVVEGVLRLEKGRRPVPYQLLVLPIHLADAATAAADAAALAEGGGGGGMCPARLRKGRFGMRR